MGPAGSCCFLVFLWVQGSPAFTSSHPPCRPRISLLTCPPLNVPVFRSRPSLLPPSCKFPKPYICVYMYSKNIIMWHKHPPDYDIIRVPDMPITGSSNRWALLRWLALKNAFYFCVLLRGTTSK